MSSMQVTTFQHQPLALPSDIMEMGTSPLMHADDVDFELDDPDAQFVDNDKSMMDDQFDLFDGMHNDSLSAAQAQDHQMIDEQKQQQNNIHSDQALDNQSFADDDILLDDDFEQHHQDAVVDIESGEDSHQLETRQSERVPNHDNEPIQLEQDELHPTNQDTNPTALDNSPPKLDSATLDQPELDAANPETEAAPSHPEDHETQRAPSNEAPEDAAHEDVVPLHPILVTFEDEQRLLFRNPDDESIAYLLEDESLATAPCQLLLAACRECLKDRMEHNDEVVLDVPKLGLQICEDSKYTSALTLARIIDTYMLLKQNEQLSTIDPLECRLSYRPCLETQMNWLITSAAEGKTFSEIAADYDVVESEYSVEEADARVDDLAHDPTDASLGHDAENEHEPVPDAESEGDDEAVEDTVEAEIPAAEDDEADPEVAELSHQQDHFKPSALPPATTDAPSTDSVAQEAHISQTSRTAEDALSEQGYVELEADAEEIPPPDPTVSLPLSEPEVAEGLVDDPEDADAYQDDLVELDLISDDENGLEDRVKTASEGALHLTPSKSLNGKRKTLDHADDDDDLLLDISTPEPKRQRPS